MKNAILALVLFLASPAFAAGDVYDCEMTLVETVNVLHIQYTPDPAIDIDYKKGVPATMVTSTREITPGIFTGDFSALDYHAGEENGKGTVLYTAEYRHPKTVFSFATDHCNPNPNPPYTHQCYIDFTDGTGSLQTFGMSVDGIQPKDTLAPSGAEYSVWTNGFIDQSDDSLELQLMFTRMHFDASGMVIKQAVARANFEDRPNTIKLLASTYTGMSNDENPGDESEGSWKSDDVELFCRKR